MSYPKITPLSVVLFLFFLLGVTYAIATPPLESSDEYKHYPVVQYIQTTGQLPILDPNDPGKWLQEGAQPPLYYLIMAAVTLPIDTGDIDEIHQINPHAFIGNADHIKNKNIILHNPDAESWPWQGTILAVYLIRLVSIGLGCITIWLIYRTGTLLVSDEIGLLAAVLTAFNPMFLFISAAVNNDSLSALLGTWGLYLLIKLWQDIPDPRQHWRRYLLLGVVCGLGLLTKLSLAGILLLAGIVTALRAWQTKDWTILFVGGLNTFITAVAISGWWIWRNWQLYGDLTGLAPFIAVQGTRDDPSIFAIDWIGEWGTFYRTFWGLFGGINVIAPDPFYIICNILFIVGIGGTAVYFFQNWKHRPFGWWLLPAWITILFILLIRWNIISPAFQGRLIFPAIAAVNILWAIGIWQLVPRSYAQWTHWGAGAVFALWAILLPWITILPAYAYPQPVDMPADVAFGPISFLLPNDEEIELVGMQLKEGQSITPNEKPVEITLYWTARTPLTDNYVTSIHLLGRELSDLGQVDRYPGWGTWPTSNWEVGQIWEDSYRVWIEEADLEQMPSRLQISIDVLGSIAEDSNGTEIPLVIAGEARLAPDRPRQVPPSLIDQGAAFRFAEGVTLHGYETAVAQDSIAATLWWEASGPLPTNYTVFVQLLDSNGQYLLGADAPPLNGDYPTSMWAEGDIIDDPHTFFGTSDLPDGDYQLAFGFYDPVTGVRIPLESGGDAVVVPFQLSQP